MFVAVTWNNAEPFSLVCSIENVFFVVNLSRFDNVLDMTIRKSFIYF